MTRCCYGIKKKILFTKIVNPEVINGKTKIEYTYLYIFKKIA